MKKNVLIAGASGMIGGLLLDLCLQTDSIGEVVSLVRRKSNTTHPKLMELAVDDFETYEALKSNVFRPDVVFFCIGVYTGAVAADKFRKITVDYPVKLAQIVHRVNPDAVFCLLSGAGADRSGKSRMMFAKDKGAAENELSAMGFRQFYAFRPSYIYPEVPRKEPNFSYRMMRIFYPLMRLFGDSVSIRSGQLAQAMFSIALSGDKQEVWENKDMLDYLQQASAQQ